VEHLTDIIGRHAWDLFKQIEAMGGYSAAVANGFLAETFERTDAAYTAEVDKLERVVVGVNKYPTPFEGKQRSSLTTIRTKMSFNHREHREGTENTEIFALCPL
jgi:methylmalonyl-CoA mutase N-terminal domain/subunit